jgi:hypothetical protein
VATTRAVIITTPAHRKSGNATEPTAHEARYQPAAAEGNTSYTSCTGEIPPKSVSEGGLVHYPPASSWPSDDKPRPPGVGVAYWLGQRERAFRHPTGGLPQADKPLFDIEVEVEVRVMLKFPT